ncbi:MAG TPA: MmgE/PrpD family protein [Methylomirabilota bacterium]|jgi:2-methylcitrate dehydratase PrpD
MSAAARLAEFVVKTSLEECPAEAVVRVRRAALDTLGVMLAGAAEPVAGIVRKVVRAEGGIPLATVVGTPLKTAPGWAALANGAAGHAHDFDDTNFALLGHPSVPLLSAALAGAEAEMASGRALVLAYIIGFEIDVALGTSLNPDHYTRGWHATSSIGTLGCAAAAARIMGLDVVQTRHALAIAASHASGLKENFGSMTKPYHAGHAARNGILAAQLAREGMTASETAIEGRQGYVAAFGGGRGLDQALETLGRSWHLVSSGLAVKPYPSCALTHSAIDALIDLRAEHRLNPREVAAIQVGVNRVVPDVLAHARPSTALERKFSMQYCAAAALAEGRVDFASFTDGEVGNRDIRDLMERVAMVVDPGLPQAVEQQAWSRVTITLRDGRTLATDARGARGHPDTPLSDAALRDKFLACARTVLSPDEAEGVAEQIGHLEDIPDIRALTSRLEGDLE